MTAATHKRTAPDPIARRGLLKCMSWAGAGLAWSVAGGVPAFGALDEAAAAGKSAAFTFVQVSDSHIGFAKPAINPDSRITYREAIAKIRAMPALPAFIVHTGDVSQLSKDSEFDDADQIVKEVGLPVFHIPGEHDMLDEGGGKAFLARYGKDTKGDGWHAFDHGGVHFVALINVAHLKAGGMGSLGPDQLAWLKNDLSGRSASTPIVVLAHIPLWSVYPEWGWGTEDSAQALAMLARFGSVTVLNGHIHQVLQKTEGAVTFQTASSLAFPQPAPGTAQAPGPMKVSADKLRDVLGLRSIAYARRGPPRLTDLPLSA